jgi:hypothetical protein
MQKKYISELKVGDLVRAHGGIFQVTTDARESQSHRPTYWISGAGRIELPGACPVAYATAVCIEGEIPGYFKPGSSWDFQGNFLAGKLTLVINERI